jgi:hypothetical protein
MTATMLVITVGLATILSASISWLALEASNITSPEALFLVPAGAGLASCCIAAVGTVAKMSRFLKRAAQSSQDA